MMRCKIIELGPDAAFFGQDKRLCSKSGTLKRSDTVPGKWLQGNFTFDDKSVTGIRYLNFYQIKVVPI